MSHWVELGGFCLAYDKRNTFIEVTTTLGLRTADGNPVRAPGSDKLLSELQIGQSWVARSRSFTLVIQMTGIRQGPEHTGHGGLQWLYQLVAESEVSMGRSIWQ